MLILVKAPRDDELSTLDKGKSRAAVDYITMAHREGKHLICGSPHDIDQLCLILNLPEREEGILHTVASRYSEYGGIRRDSAVYAELSWSENSPRVKHSGGQTVFHIPYTKIDNSSKIQETVILCENMTDSELLIILAKASTPQGLRLALEPDGGGGSTTFRKYGEYLRRERFTLCIVDSDRGSATSGLGSTAKAVEQEHKNATRAQHVLVLACRETENLFNTEVWTKCGLSGEICDRLTHLVKKSPDVAKYMDIKSGVSGFEILTESAPWDKIPNSNPAITCTTSGTPTCGKKNECTCTVWQGFGNRALETLLGWAQGASRSKLQKVINSSPPELSAKLRYIREFGFAPWVSSC